MWPLQCSPQRQQTSSKQPNTARAAGPHTNNNTTTSRFIPTTETHAPPSRNSRPSSPHHHHPFLQSPLPPPLPPPHPFLPSLIVACTRLQSGSNGRHGARGRERLVACMREWKWKFKADSIDDTIVVLQLHYINSALPWQTTLVKQWLTRCAPAFRSERTCSRRPRTLL